MSIGKIILIGVGALAVLGAGVLLYGYLHEGWRLDSTDMIVDLFSSRKPEVDDRIGTRHWDVDLPDSSVVMIAADRIDVAISPADIDVATIDAVLEGEASDSASFGVGLERRNEHTLVVRAVPLRAYAAGSGRSKLTLRLPEHTRVLIDVGNGNVAAENLSGDLTATVRKGMVEIDGARGTVRAKTLGGGITLERCRGAIDADASGEVRLDYNEGSCSVAATERVTARNHSGSLEVSCVTGGIFATLIGVGDGCRLTALDGDVRLETLPGIRASFTVNAPLGQIRAGLPFDTLGLESVDARMLRARINGGGVPVTILARHGDVSIMEFASRASGE